MSNSVSVASYRAVLVEVADAIDLSDFATAELKILKASTILAGLELEKGAQGATTKWRENLADLRALLDQVRTKSNANEHRIVRGRMNFSSRPRRPL